MTDSAIKLMTGLVAVAGSGIVGVVVGYCLTQRSEKKKRLDRDTREIAEKLLKLSKRLELFLSPGQSSIQASGQSEEQWRIGMSETAVELAVLTTRIDYYPEAEHVMRLTGEIAVGHYSDELLKAFRATTRKVETRLNNKAFIEARDRVRTESKDDKQKAIKALANEDYKSGEQRGKRLAKKGKSSGA